MHILVIIFSLVFILSLIAVLTIKDVLSLYKDVPLISTRNHFNLSTAEPIESHSFYDRIDNNGEIGICQPELVIYIHCVWVGEKSLEKPDEVFNRLKLSLQSNNYGFPLFGYTWDSDTNISLDGWNSAKKIAAKNGENLAIFVKDYQQLCPQSEIRVIAHSLGARVILEALEFLSTVPCRTIVNSVFLPFI